MTLSVHHQDLNTNCRPQRPSIWARVTNMIAINSQRRALLKLDDHMLHDIGVSRAEAAKEGSQASWNVPSHWCN